MMASLKSAKGIVLSVLLIPQYATSEYKPEVLAEHGGSYIFANQLMLSLSESECGYALKNVDYSQNFEMAVADVKGSLRDEDKHELQSFLDGSGFAQIKKESDEIIDSQLYGFIKSGLDKKTACGMVVSTCAITLNNAKQRWVDAKKLYSR